ncbi:MAG: fatty acid oxidation complex subunit alpha FadB [Pseudomonadales bacterium]
MIYQGKAISISMLDGNIANLVFDLENESVNKLNKLTISDLSSALDALKQTQGIQGLVLSSGKDTFIVGADITEFSALADQTDEQIADFVYGVNQTLNRIEDLPYPTIAAINGIALGGGLEICLTADFRVLASSAQVGFPEVQLGIFPGYGGTVRTPRLIGIDNAVEWIATGKQNKAAAALAVGIVDAVVEPDNLQTAAIQMLQSAINGDLDYQTRRAEKKAPVKLDDIELIMAFETCKAMVGQQAGRNMPAPLLAVKTMEKHARLERDEALKIEGQQLATLAGSDVAIAMVGLFMGDQALMAKAKTTAKGADKVQLAAVLGAGIMGGGIAYQSASTGTPIIMKDIQQSGLDQGMGEAAAILSKRVNRGRLAPEKMASILNAITPTLKYDSLDKVDMIVEAVVENPKVKAAVLSEVEALVGADTVIASNTSTIPISVLAESLQRPENFCGMHFFNPVDRMPLVEIIRGEKTSDATIAKTVKYAVALGKKPVIVNDCPGFLVNRVLFAYFAGFVGLLKDGADYLAIDKAAEKFGWPMGPALLCDVVGMDTAVHAAKVMADGFPDRMKSDFKTALEVLFDNNRLGQKNGVGFYQHKADKRGKLQKQIDETLPALLGDSAPGGREFSDEEIMDRLMIPFCFECVRCLDDDIVASPAELDMALVFGVGFPPFRGGAMRYLDTVGTAEFVARAEQYAELGAMYRPSSKLQEMAANNASLFA